jgi:hypothetical protein
MECNLVFHGDLPASKNSSLPAEKEALDEPALGWNNPFGAVAATGGLKRSQVHFRVQGWKKELVPFPRPECRDAGALRCSDW